MKTQLSKLYLYFLISFILFYPITILTPSIYRPFLFDVINPIVIILLALIYTHINQLKIYLNLMIPCLFVPVILYSEISLLYVFVYFIAVILGQMLGMSTKLITSKLLK